MKSPGRKTGVSSFGANGLSTRCYASKQRRPELEGMDPTILLAAPLILVTVLLIVIRALA
jgi:hypothetical protein